MIHSVVFTGGMAGLLIYTACSLTNSKHKTDRKLSLISWMIALMIVLAFVAETP